ncbi:LiaI-LiaF-like domain-containing protein [Pontibacter sp. SGAir0037]|uniref:LiaF transmembrane domain-containing protein n=1 Tax=Pontibacter sp. SGAir0037 TaxID=2571030 RepID=UPI0010CCD3BF|nr:DUF5668 domain-containing protein [Pontibacter sp. SGAir0037]QCR23816.1 hypothetical protein C1N53_16650 [Pontibacter sp. SGAir0037]
MEDKHITSEQYGNWGTRDNRSGRVLGGLVVIAIGAIVLAYQLDAIYLPRWVFSWKVLLIVIGIYTGARHSFRNFGWLVPILIGSIFLLEDVAPQISLRPYLWPVLIILAGVWIMFKPKRTCAPRFRRRDRFYHSAENEVAPLEPVVATKEDYIDGTAVFGGIKKHIITKDFRGGEIVTFCGGTEYNLSQADFEGEVVLDVTQVFGGTKLIVPAHWKIRSEIVAVFGGVEEKRPSGPADQTENKVLVLKGVLLFGGIDIRSY